MVFFQHFTLGITSLSKLGTLGAVLEVLLIFYLGAASAVGFYTMPFMRNVRPQRRRTSLSQLILNCALVLILSSALPLLSRIIGVLYCEEFWFWSFLIIYFVTFKSINYIFITPGISNFDLLGDFGEIEWLGNFRIVFLYNLTFGTATTFCIVNKFTARVRRELCARLVENYKSIVDYISFIN